VGDAVGMDARLAEISGPGRLAGTGEGITAEELALAARNRGMPLEALRYDVTPAGLHYLLIHYDIPPAAADTWRLTVDGLVDAPVTASRYRPSTATRSGWSCPAGTAWHT